MNQTATQYGMAGVQDNSSTFIKECGYHIDILDSIYECKGYTDSDHFAVAQSTVTLELTTINYIRINL